ncbi:hypothetical protein HYZ78_00410 [Candidatus Microgenomates bacterium]|nr:hypothetical protein [Candidatus Microgenomates bacterium]
MSKNKKDDWEYFDDCAICRAMEIARKEGRDLTEQQLKEVFAKQNLENRLKEKKK